MYLPVSFGFWMSATFFSGLIVSAGSKVQTRQIGE